MTNYNKWERFDADEAIKEQDRKDEILALQENRRIEMLQQAKQLEAFAIETKRQAEAVQSKADVEALKKSGRLRRNRGAIKSEAVSHNVSTLREGEIDDKSIQTSIDLQKKYSPVEIIAAVTDYLFSLLKDVEALQPRTEHKQKHADGYKIALLCLRKSTIFSQLKLILCSNKSNAEKVVEDLNIAEDFLLRQSLTCLSLFSLSSGKFSITSELSGAILRKDKREGLLGDPGVWIMRAMAFAGMGNMYLCHLHLKSAQNAAAKSKSQYHNLQDLLFLAEHCAIANSQNNSTYLTSAQETFFREFRSFSMSYQSFLANSPDLTVLYPDDLTFLANIQSHQSVSSKELTDNQLFLHFFRSSGDASSTELSLLSFLHKVYYEGQVLFLEGMGHSAESKYVVVAVIIEEILMDDSFLSQLGRSVAVLSSGEELSPSKMRSFFTNWLGATFLNIVACRLHRHHLNQGGDTLAARENTTAFWARAVNINSSTTLSICDCAIAILDIPAAHFRRIKVLEALLSFSEALEEARLSIQRLPVWCESNCDQARAIVSDNGIMQSLRLYYLTGLELSVSFGAENEKETILSSVGDDPFDSTLISSLLATSISKNPLDGLCSWNLHSHSSSILSGFYPKEDKDIPLDKWRHIFEDEERALVFRVKQFCK